MENSYVEVGSKEVNVLKWLVGNTEKYDGVLNKVHINPNGALETLNLAGQLRWSYAPALAMAMANALDLNVSQDGLIDDSMVEIVKPQRVAVLGSVKDAHNFPGSSYFAPLVNAEKIVALNPQFLVEILAGFAGQVEMIIPDPVCDYNGENCYVKNPIGIRGITHSGDSAFVVLMPMHVKSLPRPWNPINDIVEVEAEVENE